MSRQFWSLDASTEFHGEADWSVTVTQPLPDCPSVESGWERIASQTSWSEWRSESKMRSKDVSTSVVPPATEPLLTGDEYVVKIRRFMRIRCRVLESPSSGIATADDEMVFDATGVTLGGIVKARFRFTIFRGEDGTITARAQERIRTLPFFTPSKESLESEHRRTFTDLNRELPLLVRVVLLAYYQGLGREPKPAIGYALDPSGLTRVVTWVRAASDLGRGPNTLSPVWNCSSR